jgi:translation initiation factor 1 (eIF-1/SUI1)
MDSVEKNITTTITNNSTQTNNNSTQTNNNLTQTTPPPVPVTYCGVCGIPPEYCCYGDKWKLCIEWITDHFPFKSEDDKNRLLQDWENTFQTQNRSKQKTAGTAGGEGESATSEPEHFIIITVNNRGKKRFVTEIHGISHYSDDLKLVCTKVKKKFACSAILTGDSMKGRKGERNTKKQEKWQEREKEYETRKLKKNGMIKGSDSDNESEEDSKKPSSQPKAKKTVQVEEFIEAQGDISKDLCEFFANEFKIPLSCIKLNKK